MEETKKEKKRGSALLLATILLFVVLSMVISLTYVTVMEQKMSQKTKSSVGSFFSAESGVEWALNKIANNSGTISSVLIGLVTSADGKISCPFPGTPCSVYFLDSSGNVIKKADFTKDISEVKAVRSVGSQGNETQRAIEAAVASGAISEERVRCYLQGGEIVADLSNGGEGNEINSIGAQKCQKLANCDVDTSLTYCIAAFGHSGGIPQDYCSWSCKWTGS